MLKHEPRSRAPPAVALLATGRRFLFGASIQLYFELENMCVYNYAPTPHTAAAPSERLPDAAQKAYTASFVPTQSGDVISLFRLFSVPGLTITVLRFTTGCFWR